MHTAGTSSRAWERVVKKTVSRIWRSRGEIGNELVGTTLSGDNNAEETRREG